MSNKESRKQVIATRLREARTLAGLTQAQVAKRLGLHRPSISEAEAGNRAVTAEEVATLAELYDVDPSWLLGEEVDTSERAGKAMLAARELEKLAPNDLDRLLRILGTLREKAN
jgi:transcriptional regulator with XRE-family HTH domain